MGKDVCFTYLTQYMPPKEDFAKIEQENNKCYKHMLFRDIQLGLEDFEKPVVKLFCNYLGENIMRYQTKIHEGALWLFLVKTFCLPHQTGYGKKVSVENIGNVPSLLETLIKNTKVLGDRFYYDFGKHFNVRPSTNLSFDQLFKVSNGTLLKDAKKQIDNGNKEEMYIERKRRIGGEFWISFNGKIKQKNTNNWLMIEGAYAFILDANTRKTKKMKIALAASLGGRGIGWHYPNKYKKIKYKTKENHFILPEEDWVYLEILKLFKETISNCFEEVGDEISAKIKKALGSLSNDLDKKIAKYD